LASKDYYQTLRVDRNADQASIKQAYRRLAMQYHPDQNPGNPEAIAIMKEINEAYAVLGDPDKRQAYDMRGTMQHQNMVMEDVFPGMDLGSFFREFGLEDIFGDSLFDMFFGRRRSPRKRTAPRGSDKVYELELTEAEAFSGVEKQIELYRTGECPVCHGSGAKYAGIVECDQCLGSGQIVRQQRTGLGLFRQVIRCPVCGGRGKMIINPCDRCQGRGVVGKREKLSVRVPPHVADGDAMKVPEHGDVGESGTEPGDLYVVLHVT